MRDNLPRQTAGLVHLEDTRRREVASRATRSPRTQPREPTELIQGYTRSEVARMIGVSQRQLDHWTRLRLIKPRAHRGKRFYSFKDLVALETIKRLAAKRIPARRLRRAIDALRQQLGLARAPLSQLRVVTNGRELVILPPHSQSRPVEPLTGQFVLDFDLAELGGKVRTIASRTAEEWFEIGLACESTPAKLKQAVQAYRCVRELAPNWVEAHINLGTTLYYLQQLEESKRSFVAAVVLEPNNPLAHFNLGCILERLGEIDAAIVHLQRAAKLAPRLADAHLNLALAYDSRGRKEEAGKQLSLYLQCEQQGAWADFGRSRITPNSAPERSGRLTPFPRKR